MISVRSVSPAPSGPKVLGYGKRLFTDLLLIGAGVLLFALSFPSFLSTWGWFPLAFLALVPVFIVVHRSGWVSIFFYGLLYGYLSYSVYNYWLVNFHPIAGLVVPIIYAAFCAILFPALKAADSLFRRNGFLVQILIWIGYELLKTVGFLGYPYGIIGYTQYAFIPLIQIASFAGVWGVSLMVVFPSAVIGDALKDGVAGFIGNLGKRKIHLAAYAILFSAAVVYGSTVPKDYLESPQWKVALVQQNVDPWKGGTNPYKQSLEICLRLSREAEEHDPDIVIWSETSFVPGIEWHSRYRTDPDRYLLVRELLDFMAEREIPYVIGNDHGEKRSELGGSLERKDSNATILFDYGEIQQIYRKILLVPFTENFPFQDVFPKLYALVKTFDVHFWERGDEYTVFDARGVAFSTPICYEDTFGTLSRRFVNEGAQVIVNLTNDAWSKSDVAEIQHMIMAVFRAVENRRTVIRSTNAGITCTILPNGRIQAMLEPFVEGYLIDTVPIYTDETTLYTRWGDYLAFAALFSGILLLIFGTVRRIVVLRRTDD